MAYRMAFQKTGGPEVIARQDFTPVPPGPGELAIRHTAIGVNFIDTYHRSGLYPVGLPAAPGIEAAGVVEAIGEGVSGFAPGDRIGYFTGRPGANEAVHVAARIAVSAAAVIGLFFFAIPRQLLAVFGMNEPAVVEIGTQLLRILSVSGFFIAVALTYTGGLQGTGDTKSPLYISIVSQVLVPLGICFVVQRLTTLQPLHIWIAILVGHATRCGLSVARFNQGAWRRIRVDLGEATS